VRPWVWSQRGLERSSRRLRLGQPLPPLAQLGISIHHDNHRRLRPRLREYGVASALTLISTVRFPARQCRNDFDGVKKGNSSQKARSPKPRTFDDGTVTLHLESTLREYGFGPKIPTEVLLEEFDLFMREIRPNSGQSYLPEFLPRVESVDT
jgi:hypothetical protein